MVFETRFEAAQDFDGFRNGWLDDINFLETPRQCPVLLKNTAEFLVGGRADTAQFTRSQHRFDQVGSIHDTTGSGTGADDRVNFINEQHRTFNLVQFGQYRFESLFEIATVLGAGQQCAEIECIDGRIGQYLGHLAFDDPQCQSFSHGGLADTGLADKKRVVLASAAQYLDRAVDFIHTSDQRVDLAFACTFIEVAGEIFKCAFAGIGTLFRPFPTLCPLRCRVNAFLQR